DQRADPQQYVFEGSDVRPRRTPIAVQLRKRSERTDHSVGVAAGDRGDANRNILQELGRGPPRTAGQHRAEVLVLDDADDHLDAAVDDRLDLISLNLAA